jgi:hypothetical protein
VADVRQFFWDNLISVRVCVSAECDKDVKAHFVALGVFMYTLVAML